MSLPVHGAVRFQIVERGTTTTTVVVPPGGSLGLHVLAITIDAEDGVDADLDSFTYRVIFPNAQFTWESNSFGRPFDNEPAPRGFNGSIPWTGLALAITSIVDTGSPLSTPLVADLYRTTAAEDGGPASGRNVILETLTVKVPSSPVEYAVRLLVLEAADRTGAFHRTENGVDFIVTVAAQSTQLPGDCNQDGRRDISDAVCLFGFLFLGTPLQLSCADRSAADPANKSLLNHNGDARVDISDGIGLLNFLFSNGTPPASGTDCLPIPGCPMRCVTP